MRSILNPNGRGVRSLFYQVLMSAALMIFLLILPAGVAADVSYFIFGRVFSIHQTTDEVESQTTSAIPGVTINEPESPNDPSSPVPLPGVTIEVYKMDTNALLGSGRANREGFYNLSYTAPEADHRIRFLVYLDFVDGEREFVGEVNRTTSGDFIEVNNRLFSFDLHVINESAVKAGTAMFSSTDQFMFIEVGDIDMDDIYDEQQDSGDPNKWGLTKPLSPGHTLGPDYGFGGRLELYGIFGETDNARYYKINCTGPGSVSGNIQDPLFKKNFVIIGTGIEVYRIMMGPKDVSIGPITLTDVYELDERLAGEPISSHPGKFFSSYWTELGLRAVWNTRGLTDGKYTLSVEAWDKFGNMLAPSTNNFATLNIHLVNTPPESHIHNIQYLDGTIVLSDTAPCQTVILNKISFSTDDDNLKFEITTRHPTSGFFRDYTLNAWFGHNTYAGIISSGSTPLINGIVATPASITYQSCAYRFRLRVVPRITNGYHIIYVRDDNWYASFYVHE